MSFTYTEDKKDYSHLIGKVVRGVNMVIIGTVKSITKEIDGWGHENSWAILDNGRKINCRTFNRQG
jgi:hypothetical protein